MTAKRVTRSLPFGLGLSLLLLCGAASAAHAGGALFDAAGALGANSARGYRQRIAAARRADARSFRVVARLRALLPTLAKQRRGRGVTVLLPLAALGASGRWAMADELFFSGAGQGTLDAVAWRGWRVSLLEAIGRLRRADMAPLLRAAVRHDDSDARVARAAVEALGRFGDPSDVDLLVNAATQRGRDAHQLLDALGDCRRSAMVTRLTKLLATPGHDTPARLSILKSLGRAGNAYAWRTSAVRKSGEEQAVRSAAAKALIDVYATTTDASERDRAATSVLVVGWSRTPQLIAAAKTRHPQQSESLDSLAKRFARSPVR
ncbi:MAG: HEAT repeat domain-containing protein [Myxococcales bacterium]|nr:HEAT repeat domain-containing protein [Myxococcales bacterium]